MAPGMALLASWLADCWPGLVWLDGFNGCVWFSIRFRGSMGVKSLTVCGNRKRWAAGSRETFVRFQLAACPASWLASWLSG